MRLAALAARELGKETQRPAAQVLGRLEPAAQVLGRPGSTEAGESRGACSTEAGDARGSCSTEAGKARGAYSMEAGEA